MKELIPGLGEKTTKQKIKDLENKAATLPVIFALLFTEALKKTIELLSLPYITVPSPIKFLLVALVVGVIYVYGVDREMYAQKAKNTAESAKEKAQDIKDGDD